MKLAMIRVNKEKILIVVLAGLLFLVIQYMILDRLFEIDLEKKTEVFQQGYDQGFIDAVSILFHNTENCNSVPLYFGNLTRDVIDISCVESKLNISNPESAN